MAGKAGTAGRVETEDMAAPTLTRRRSNRPSEPAGRSIAALRPAAVRSDGAVPRSSARAPDDLATRADRRLGVRSRRAALRSNYPREPADRSIAALRPADVRSDGAAPRSSVRAPDDPATRADRRRDGEPRRARLRNSRAACTPARMAVSHYRHRVSQHCSRRLVHYSRHRSVHDSPRRFVHRRSPRRCRRCLWHRSRSTHHCCQPNRYRSRLRRRSCVLPARAYATRRATARSRPATFRSAVRLWIDPAWCVSVARAGPICRRSGR